MAETVTTPAPSGSVPAGSAAPETDVLDVPVDLDSVEPERVLRPHLKAAEFKSMKEAQKVLKETGWGPAEVRAAAQYIAQVQAAQQQQQVEPAPDPNDEKVKLNKALYDVAPELRDMPAWRQQQEASQIRGAVREAQNSLTEFLSEHNLDLTDAGRINIESTILDHLRADPDELAAWKHGYADRVTRRLAQKVLTDLGLFKPKAAKAELAAKEAALRRTQQTVPPRVAAGQPAPSGPPAQAAPKFEEMHKSVAADLRAINRASAE